MHCNTYQIHCIDLLKILCLSLLKVTKEKYSREILNERGRNSIKPNYQTHHLYSAMMNVDNVSFDWFLI